MGVYQNFKSIKEEMDFYFDENLLEEDLKKSLTPVG